MSKHTPGPWSISHGGFQTDDGFTIASNNAAADRVKMICECWPCTIVDQQHRNELLANAQLIADAPEMLRLIKYLYQSPDVKIDTADRVLCGEEAEKQQQEFERAMGQIAELIARHDPQ